MKISHIAINPTGYREHCFDVKELKCSRWEVDFYLINDQFEEGFDEESERLIPVSLQFTAYNLKRETPRNAYKFLQKALNVLVECYCIDRKYPSHSGTFHQDISLQDIATNELKEVLNFTDKLLEKRPVFSKSNIDDLASYTYIYYSSVKWLDYPFHNGSADHQIFEDLESFETLLNGKYELKDTLNANLY